MLSVVYVWILRERAKFELILRVSVWLRVAELNTCGHVCRDVYDGYVVEMCVCLFMYVCISIYLCLVLVCITNLEMDLEIYKHICI